jgi:hypothetical protein
MADVIEVQVVSRGKKKKVVGEHSRSTRRLAPPIKFERSIVTYFRGRQPHRSTHRPDPQTVKFPQQNVCNAEGPARRRSIWLLQIRVV